jgi:lambda family phage tail tape measure protein
MAGAERRTLSIVARLEDFASRQAKRMGVTMEQTIAGQIVGSFKKWRAELGYFRSAWSLTWSVLSAPIRAPLALIDKFTSKLFSLRNLIAGFVVVRAAGGLLGSFGDVAEDLDRTAKLINRLSGTAESLTAIKFAAQSAGTSLEELRPGFVSLQRNIEAARRGSVEQRIALADLGIEVDSLNTRQIDYVDLLAKVADRYRTLDSATERTTALTTAFGESGAALGPLLEQGADGIRKLAAEAQRRGLVFTRDELARAEQYEDALLRVRSAIQNIFQRLFLSSAGGLSSFLDRITTFIEANRDKIIAAFQTIGRAVLKVVDLISEAVIGLIGVLEKIPGVVVIPPEVKREYDELTKQLKTLDRVGNSQAGIDGLRENVRQNDITFRKKPYELYLNTLGFLSTPDEGIALSVLERLLPNREQMQKRSDELAKQLEGHLAESLRKEKASIFGALQDAFSGGSSGTDQTSLFRTILEQAGIRSDDDVVRAVGAGIISPEALLEGVRSGLFSSGVLDRIQALVTGEVAKKVAPTQQDLRVQATRIKELQDLEVALLGLERPTAAVQARLAQLDGQSRQLDLAQRLVPQLEAGTVAGESLAQVMDLLTKNTERALAAVGRAEKSNQLSFRQQVLDLAPPSRAANVERAQIEGEQRKLQFQEAFDQGRISAEQLAVAIEKVDAQTERLAARARGDLAGGFAEAATQGIEAFTNLTAIGEQAAQSLVVNGLDRLTDGLASVIDGTKSGKEAFKDFARSMLSSLAQIISKLLIMRALQGLGSALGLGGTGLGDALGLTTKAEGGVIRGRMLAMRKFADGGVANRPTLGLFGEAGAEAFVPLRGGKIPVALTNRGQEQGLVVNFQVDATDAQSFRAMLRSERHAIGALVQNAIETRRGMRRTVRRATR